MRSQDVQKKLQHDLTKKTWSAAGKKFVGCESDLANTTGAGDIFIMWKSKMLLVRMSKTWPNNFHFLSLQVNKFSIIMAEWLMCNNRIDQIINNLGKFPL